jgi:hypothetical protein
LLGLLLSSFTQAKDGLEQALANVCYRWSLKKKSVLSMGQSRIYRHNIKTSQIKIIGHPKQTPSVQMLERYMHHR